MVVGRSTLVRLSSITFKLRCRSAERTLYPPQGYGFGQGTDFRTRTRTPTYPWPIPARVSVPVSITMDHPDADGNFYLGGVNNGRGLGIPIHSSVTL